MGIRDISPVTFTRAEASAEGCPVRSAPERSAEAFNAFFFTPAIASKGGVSLSTIFSTHPTLEKRLDQLAKIEAELATPA